MMLRFTKPEEEELERLGIQRFDLFKYVVKEKQIKS